MENDQPFEAEAALEAGERARINAGHIHGARGVGITSAGNEAFDKHATTSIAQEDEPLLSVSREGSTSGPASAKWDGDLDYAGLTWWKRHSVWCISPWFDLKH